ncbi:MAG: hypothetical protein KAH32_02375 [Chlamydiia bacterium]|nr:hypothetical protein [Chlamydiia bacterium]
MDTNIFRASPRFISRSTSYEDKTIGTAPLVWSEDSEKCFENKEKNTDIGSTANKYSDLSLERRGHKRYLENQKQKKMMGNTDHHEANEDVKEKFLEEKSASTLHRVKRCENLLDLDIDSLLSVSMKDIVKIQDVDSMSVHDKHLIIRDTKIKLKSRNIASIIGHNSADAICLLYKFKHIAESDETSKFSGGRFSFEELGAICKESGTTPFSETEFIELLILNENARLLNKEKKIINIARAFQDLSLKASLISDY